MFFTYQNIPVYYEDKGMGKPLLLLHGWGCSSSIFANITNFFSSRYNVIVPDFPPFGLSAEPQNDFTVSDYKNLILALLDNLKIKSANIICHSFGGRVAVKLAAENTERVDKIVFCSSAGLPYKKTFLKKLKKLQYNIYKFFCNKGIINKNKLKRFNSCDYNNLPQNMKKTFVNIIKEDLTSYIKKIDKKSLIIWGEKDKETPLYMAKKFNEYIKGSNLVVLKGCGHYGFLDDSKGFLSCADKFFGE